jgi:UDP-glucose 4-epimerase
LRILITGSSGLVGCAIAELLHDTHDVVGLDLTPGRHTTHLGSVTDHHAVSSCLDNVDAVIHVASLHVPDLERASTTRFTDVNVRGTTNLLEGAISRGVRTFIYSSTTSVYGSAMVPKDRAVWVTEDLRLEPRDIYDRTKLEAEQLCREAARSAEVSCISLRFSRCFPEASHLVAAYRLYRGVDLRDVAAAHVLALNARIRGFEVFNISARSPFMPNDCEQILVDPRPVLRTRCPGVEEAFSARSWPLPRSIDRVYSIVKAASVLGYSPKYNFWEYIAGLTTRP